MHKNMLNFALDCTQQELYIYTALSGLGLRNCTEMFSQYLTLFEN